MGVCAMLSVVATVVVVVVAAAVAAVGGLEQKELECLRMSVRGGRGEFVVERGDAAAHWSWPRS